MKHCDFDVIVVGGGHAGTEAAMASYRRGAKTALVTHRFDRLGEMSCNPAIGGIGKGHIVREIDALDGVMARTADRAAIQFRLLNRSKGPAVRGPRVQVDRSLFRRAIQCEFHSRPDLRVIEDEVIDLTGESGAIWQIVTREGTTLRARAVVLTTGTFLRGVIHIGGKREPAGRMGDPASERLAARIAELGLPLGRLKTGTPPRIDGRSIDWTRIGAQAGDGVPTMMSFLSSGPAVRQVPCGTTKTCARTHEIIRGDISRSAVYGGAITGSGPRYCPSIEDKVVRFADKESHQVFLEPEGLDTDLVYPNGISTSLPEETQVPMVRSIQGLEKANIIRFGYSIEYDYVDPSSLDRTLCVKSSPGFFLAGQINGTTGYEEAAGQGLVAGLNAAAHAMGRDRILLDRSQSYIGVMIDDLVTKGVTEPYRIFTSRSEYRLALRADNADQRLTPVGIAIGCVSEDRRTAFERKCEARDTARAGISARVVTAVEAETLGISLKSGRRSLLHLLADANVPLDRLAAQFSEVSDLKPGVLDQIHGDAIYEPYLERLQFEILRVQRDEKVRLPDSLCYESMPGLSSELSEKLTRVRPTTLGQASRVEGMTPAALTLILLRANQVRATSRVP